MQLGEPQGELFTGPPSESMPKAVEWMESKGLNLEEDPDFTDKKNHCIICVGDVVSKAFLEDPRLNKFVKFCFIDGNTQRGDKISLNLSFDGENLSETSYKSERAKKAIIKFKKVKNPREHIREEIFDFIQERIHDPYQYIIEVNGEEDLLVLPATINSHRDFIFYGQPPITSANISVEAGCVGIFSDEKTKMRFREVLGEFDKIKWTEHEQIPQQLDNLPDGTVTNFNIINKAKVGWDVEKKVKKNSSNQIQKLIKNEVFFKILSNMKVSL